MEKALFKINIVESPFRNFRDELVAKITEGINRERFGTRFKPINKKTVAIRINRNPFLAKDDGEVELLWKECEQKGTYKKFFWVTKTTWTK